MKKIILPLLLFSVLFSCKKDETSCEFEGKTFTVNSSSHSTWTYFSFANNDTIKVVNPQDDLSWDLAFQRFNIRTNGGKSGKGMAGIYNTKKTGECELSKLNTVPENITFVTDDTITTTGAMGKTVKVLANPALADWYIYTEGSSSLLSNEYVYIVKTADGKYAKMIIKSYYNESGTAGYFTINYSFQADGSRKLD